MRAILLAGLVALFTPASVSSPLALVPRHVLRGTVAPDTAAAAVQFVESAGERRKAIILEIDSPGGLVSSGLLVSRAIEESPAVVVCIVDGSAGSMAFYILQSCDIRLMTKRGRLMTHEPALHLDEDYYSLSELRDLADQQYVSDESFAAHCRARLNVTPEEYRRHVERRLWVMDWREALRVGAVDQVVPDVASVVDYLRRLL